MGITISYRLGIDTDRIFCIGYYLSLIADVILRVAPSATQWGDRGPSTTHPYILLRFTVGSGMSSARNLLIWTCS